MSTWVLSSSLYTDHIISRTIRITYTIYSLSYSGLAVELEYQTRKITGTRSRVRCLVYSKQRWAGCWPAQANSAFYHSITKGRLYCTFILNGTGNEYGVKAMKACGDGLLCIRQTHTLTIQNPYIPVQYRTTSKQHEIKQPKIFKL